MADTNGNTITNHGNGIFKDTLGKTALTIAGSGTAASPRMFTYSAPTGTATVIVTYKTYAVQTNFTCSIGQFNQLHSGTSYLSPAPSLLLGCRTRTECRRNHNFRPRTPPRGTVQNFTHTHDRYGNRSAQNAPGRPRAEHHLQTFHQGNNITDSVSSPLMPKTPRSPARSRAPGDGQPPLQVSGFPAAAS
jgi:hypothetical protein